MARATAKTAARQQMKFGASVSVPPIYSLLAQVICNHNEDISGSLNTQDTATFNDAA